MFVFRGEFGCVLHTGDFRWEIDGIYSEKLEIRKRQLVAALGGSRVDCLHLDNTFCNARFSFPPRHIAAQQVLDIIASHKGYDVIVGIDMLGKEDLLIFLAEALKSKIWIWPERLRTVRLLGLPDIFTTDTTATRIRAVPRYSISLETLHMLNKIRPTIAVIPSGLSCLRKNWSTGRACLDAASLQSIKTSKEVGFEHGFFGGSNAHRIVPFSGKEGNDCQAKAGNGDTTSDIFFVPYSLHSCFSELKEFLEFVKPTSVRGNLKSSSYDINPRHHFQHLCHMHVQNVRQFQSNVELRRPKFNVLEQDGCSNCFDSKVEGSNCDTQVYGSVDCQINRLDRRRLRKAATIRSRKAWTALRKRRGGGILVYPDVSDDRQTHLDVHAPKGVQG